MINYYSIWFKNVHLPKYNADDILSLLQLIAIRH